MKKLNLYKTSSSTSERQVKGKKIMKNKEDQITKDNFCKLMRGEF